MQEVSRWPQDSKTRVSAGWLSRVFTQGAGPAALLLLLQPFQGLQDMGWQTGLNGAGGQKCRVGLRKEDELHEPYEALSEARKMGSEGGKDSGFHLHF